MYLEPSKQQYHLPQHQSGVSLAILLFIIIVLGLLAASLANINSQSTSSNAQQVIATRAFFAAESGANRQAMAIFPLDGSGGTCASQTYNFNVSGLNGCSATTNCTAFTVNTQTFYQVVSQGQCNTGQPLQATRTIEVRFKDVN